MTGLDQSAVRFAQSRILARVHGLGAPIRTGGTWSASGELDMMESLNALNSASQTFHYQLGGAAESTGTGLIACHASKCPSGYHTYR